MRSKMKIVDIDLASLSGSSAWGSDPAVIVEEIEEAEKMDKRSKGKLSKELGMPVRRFLLAHV